MLHFVKNILLVPLLAVQGIWVKKKSIRLPEAKGKRAGAVQFSNSNEPVEFLMLGDSVAAGVGVNTLENSLSGQIISLMSNKLDSNIKWQNISQSGYKLNDAINNINLSYSSIKSYIVVSIGVNDITGMTSTTNWKEQMVLLLSMLVKNRPNSYIVILGIPPMESFPLLPSPLNNVLGNRCRKLNAVTSSVLTEFPQAKILPITITPDTTMFASDGYHPSEKGCKEISKEIITLLSI